MPKDCICLQGAHDAIAQVIGFVDGSIMPDSPPDTPERRESDRSCASTPLSDISLNHTILYPVIFVVTGMKYLHRASSTNIYESSSLCLMADQVNVWEIGMAPATQGMQP